MNCAENKELLVEYSLGHLDANSAQELREHINGGCTTCARALAEFDEAWATVAAGLEPVPPSAEVEAKLLGMIRGESRPNVPRSVHQTVGPWSHSRVAIYVLAASLAGAAAGVLVWNRTPLGSAVVQQRPRDNSAATWGPIPSERSTVGFQTVGLNTIAEKRGIRLSVVMIPHTHEWHVVGTGLPDLGEDEEFRVWLEAKSGEFIASAPLAVENVGRGGVIINVEDLELDDLASIWLTQEASPVGLRPSEAVLFRAGFK